MVSESHVPRVKSEFSRTLVVQDSSTHALITSPLASRSSGSIGVILYVLHYYKISQSSLSQVGSFGLQKLKRMLPHLFHLQFLECEFCQFGKRVRSSFSNNVQSDSNWNLAHPQFFFSKVWKTCLVFLSKHVWSTCRLSTFVRHVFRSQIWLLKIFHVRVLKN